MITHGYSYLGSNERSSFTEGKFFYSYFVLPIHLPMRTPHQKVLFLMCMKVLSGPADNHSQMSGL